MDVVWRFLDTNDLRNWIRVRTRIYLNVIQVAASVREQDDLKRAIGVGQPEIALEECDVTATTAVRCNERRERHLWGNNHGETVAAAVAELAERAGGEVRAQQSGVGELAVRGNELGPELRAMRSIAHAPNETQDQLPRAVCACVGS